MLRSEIISFARDVSGEGYTDDDARLVERAAIDALDELANWRDWEGFKKTQRVNLIAPVTAGTVSGSGTAVTGVGTSFDSPSALRQLLLVGTDSFHHRIAAVANATNMTLEAAYQTLSSTSFSNSAYSIFYTSYRLPTTVKTVKSVIDVEIGPDRGRLYEVRKWEIESYYSDNLYGGRPRVYAIDQSVDSSGVEQLDLLLYPAPDQTYVLDLVTHRDIAAFPASGDTTTHIDVPPYLMGLYKALIIRRLGILSRRWENLVNAGVFSVEDNERRALREDLRHEGDLIIRRRGASDNELSRAWDWKITGF